MSEIWPLDVRRRLDSSVSDNMASFRCVMLMPLEQRFDQVAELIKATVLRTANGLLEQAPNIDRVDWITSTGIIQQEIWQKVQEADLVFCDITGFNPNVLFEAGVCAAWKDIRQVAFIKDHFFRQQSAFDIAPIRYTEYTLTGDGVADFERKVETVTRDVMISFPDKQGVVPVLRFPLEVNFQDNRDDPRLFTPPFAHRRVIDGALEFGSICAFPYSWASIGKEQFLNFSLEFFARFSNPVDNEAFIGVGLRSQHYYANYAHILHLKRDGRIIITEPDEDPPQFFTNNVIRGPVLIDAEGTHRFAVTFDESEVKVLIDDFTRTFRVKDMKKVFGPGLIRLQSHKCWMAVERISVKRL